ncbi:MAG: hypothetical protein AAF611_10865 [Bacteroidota bacterium]
MIQFFKSLFKKKESDVEKSISIEDEKIKFNQYKVFSSEEKLIEELSLDAIEWIEIEAEFVDRATLESCLYIKMKNNSILIDFLIQETHQKEFVKELFNALQIDQKHLAFLTKQQKRKVVYTKDESLNYHKIDDSKTGIFQKK